MENKSLCVCCGAKLTPFRYDVIWCGIAQQVCKDCKKELDALDDAERCRRVLQSGRAQEPEKVRALLDVAEGAEEHRFACLRCGSPMRFGEVLTLDNSPLWDSVFSNMFAALPAYCDGCGKIEFFDRDRLSKDKYIAYLIKKDAKK